MVIHQQILSNVSLSEEYQTHLERKKSDNAKKISAKVKFQAGHNNLGSPWQAIPG